MLTLQKVVIKEAKFAVNVMTDFAVHKAQLMFSLMTY